MKTYNLPFHRIRDRKPDNDQAIFYIRVSRFYNDSEIRYATAYYQWSGNTDETSGSSLLYSPEDDANPPAGYEKLLIIEGKGYGSEHLADEVLWCAAADYDAMLTAAEEDEEADAKAQ